jgi:hypothetical protein
MDIKYLSQSQCPVCHYSLAASFFCGGEQPLATLGWAKSSEEALEMPRHPLDYVQCPRCTHVFNRSFSYDVIPYTNKPNRMYNNGLIWQGHLAETRNVSVSKLPQNPTVIDIGCGDGHFVRGISELFSGKGRFIGFDPNASGESGMGVEFHSRFFQPLQDIQQFEPDLLVMRHVLEHLTDPSAFIDNLALGASRLAKPVYLFAEMPCIDRVFATRRLVDFFYEHPSHFTTQSFDILMKQGGNLLVLNHGYNGEVIYGLVELGLPNAYKDNIQKAVAFYQLAIASQKEIQAELTQLASNGKRIAIWGGTGKGAAFIHFFDADSTKVPVVVDSDMSKVGSFVPKMGQAIQYRDILKKQKIDILIIPSQWRSQDIIAEMERAEIAVESVLIEHNGRLVDFHKHQHPYK